MCPYLVRGCSDGLQINNFTVTRGILREHAEGIGPNGQGVDRGYVYGDADGLCAHLQHGDSLRMHMVCHNKSITYVTLLISMEHHHGFGGGRPFVQQGRVSHLKAR